MEGSSGFAQRYAQSEIPVRTQEKAAYCESEVHGEV